MIKVNPVNKYSPILTCYKKILKCSYCGREHEIKKEKSPAFGKTCTSCLKRTIFNQCENSKRKTLKELKKTKPIWKSFQ